MLKRFVGLETGLKFKKVASVACFSSLLEASNFKLH